MTTRPLDLASKLRPEPRNFDWLFFVNAALLVLFFSLFGSRFVLAPGLGLEFRLPAVEGADQNAKRPTHFITVLSNGQILTTHGRRTLDELRGWLADQAKTAKDPLLLVRGDAGVPISVLTQIASAAKKAGFVEVLWAGVELADDTNAGAR